MDQKETYTIIYQNKSIPVNKEYISLQSKVFRRLIKENPKTLRLNGGYPFDSFNQFLRAIQGMEFNTTVENCDDIIKIAQEYQIKNLVTLMEQERERLFAPENILLLAIQSNREHKSVLPYIPFLAQNISQMVKIPTFALLPVKLIDQIFSHDDCHPDNQGDLIRFFEALLDFKQKEDPSILFNHIDFGKVSFEEMDHFLNIPKLNKKAVIQKVANASLVLMDIIRSEEEGNKDTIGKTQEIVDDLKYQIDYITKAQEKIVKHQQSATRRLESAKEDVAKSIAYMRKVEAKLRQTCTRSSIPGMPKLQPVPPHRPNIFIEWCQNGFSEDGPSKRPPPPKKTKTISKNVYVTSQIKIEAPAVKIRSYAEHLGNSTYSTAPSTGFRMSGQSFGSKMNLDNVKVEMPNDRPPIKIERRTTAKAVLETGGIKIEKPVRLETTFKVPDVNEVSSSSSNPEISQSSKHEIKIEYPSRKNE
ncbi:hypothetical protein TVAG_438000 [Trichomonas vaginalis G3]|uniref:BTB domain-containing protein n=1 Tax=Trichomonas vaginalis (strain ATCC PRA-98 / G3) TaxID=412133 RepID=A2FCG1_TRIV3|nr:Potassium Channel Kv1.1, Chain A domain-containing protein [Trichomonas vaginalis G3]EAX97421.1 hypothetical protein TVAG_438000 [Trichomonas vaginalis G3]KAI5516895.1 Potassium Channel Kv1.1, Chain A domain-containing protein [Trichomonas vaginalis G3]|eukprot:XP_001310351.1 hypothetical protein [Trichomonas vaginalis G3]